jgi:excisionase family DNA binding protein
LGANPKKDFCPMSIQSRFKKPVIANVVPFSGPRMMSPEDAAKYIGHSIDLVYDMIRDGEIPFVKKGNGTKRTQYVVDRLDLDKWIDTRKESNVA